MDLTEHKLEKNRGRRRIKNKKETGTTKNQSNNQINQFSSETILQKHDEYDEHEVLIRDREKK